MNIFLNSAGTVDGCVSQAVSLGDFIYVSGQIGQGDTIEEQTVTAFNKLIDILEEMDLRADHVVKLTIYMKDLAQKQAFLNVYKNFVEAPYPAATFVQVDKLPDDALVQLDAFAISTLRYEQSSKESGCGSDCQSCSGCE